MTRSEQELLIGRYLNGELNAVEEQEFFILVATHSDLRRLLKAFRIADISIRLQTERIPAQHPDARNRLLSALNLPTEDMLDDDRGSYRSRPVRQSRPIACASSAAMIVVWVLIAILGAIVIWICLITPIRSRRTESVRRVATEVRDVDGHTTVDLWKGLLPTCSLASVMGPRSADIRGGETYPGVYATSPSNPATGSYRQYI